jgi:precorrin-2 dehydrogenase / sirohydrochlorin ferrochelatase
MNSLRPYPVFLLVSGKSCVIVGGGPVACRKALDLLECGARVTVAAEIPSSEMEELAAGGRIELRRRRFAPEDVRGAFLAFAATDDDRTNADVAETCRRAGILVNAVDDPGRSDFISGAVVRRGPLRIAVSTSGCSPKLAARIRRELEERYDASFGEFVSFAGEVREYVFTQDISRENRDNALSWLASGEAFTLFLRLGKDTVWDEIRKMLFSS